MYSQKWRGLLGREGRSSSVPLSSTLVWDCGMNTTQLWSVFWILFRQVLLSVGDKKAAILWKKCILVHSLYCYSEGPVVFKGHVVELWLVPDFFKRQTGVFRYCFFSILFEKEKENIIEINLQQIMATQNSLCSQSCFVFYNIVLLNLSYRTLLYLVSFVFSDLSYYFWGRWTEKMIISRLFYKQFYKELGIFWDRSPFLFTRKQCLAFYSVKL